MIRVRLIFAIGASLVDESPLAQGSGSHSQPLALARLSSLR